MPPGGELRHPIAEVWSRPWAGTRPTIKPVPPESHLPGTASSKRRRGAGGARGKRAHLGGSEGLADGPSGEPRTGAGFSPRREPGGAEEEDGPLSLHRGSVAPQRPRRQVQTPWPEVSENPVLITWRTPQNPPVSGPDLPPISGRAARQQSDWKTAACLVTETWKRCTPSSPQSRLR